MQAVLLHIRGIYGKYPLSAKQAPFLCLRSPSGSFYVDAMFLCIHSKGVPLSQYSTSCQLLSQPTTMCHHANRLPWPSTTVYRHANRLPWPLTTVYRHDYWCAWLTTTSCRGPRLPCTATTTGCRGPRTPATPRLPRLPWGFEKQIPRQPCGYQGTLQDRGCRPATAADGMARSLKIGVFFKNYV